ncbi:MAG: HD domain-containing protein [Candidatus Omnitrophica bacterium]|nr:HD domain-containing protein [Candidatus Omnitrophota bacterium]
MSLLTYYPQLSLVRDALKGRGQRVFLVGGALRDHYLKRRGTDFDFAVDQGAVTLSRQLARRIKGTFVLLDRQHGCARVVKKIDGEIWTFDLTDWRGPSIQKDLSLRDFTINTLAMDIFGEDPASLKVLEVKGARRDLKAGVVRMVNAKVFKEDPLRLLRAFALQAALGFKIDVLTREQIKKDAHLISKVAAERIREEIFKILASCRAYEILSGMDKIGLLAYVIPQITVMYGVAQGGYHHLDVWKHTLEALAQVERIIDEMSRSEKINIYLQERIAGGHSRLALLKMAIILHDIGKPETRRREGGRMTFHGHEHAGEGITRQIARQLKLSVKERFFLEDAVRMHLRPGYLSNFKRPSEKAIFRYLRDTKDEAASFAILGLADQAATCGSLSTEAKHKHHAKICRMLIDRYFEQKEQKPRQRLLTGHDLIKVLKLKPSELFGRILSGVEEAAALGKIKTKQEALAMASKIK